MLFSDRLLFPSVSAGAMTAMSFAFIIFFPIVSKGRKGSVGKWRGPLVELEVDPVLQVKIKINNAFFGRLNNGMNALAGP